MIDHESPSHQLHLSYDIEDIKQVRIVYCLNIRGILCKILYWRWNEFENNFLLIEKSEDFLFGNQHETSPEKEEYHS